MVKATGTTVLDAPSEGKVRFGNLLANAIRQGKRSGISEKVLEMLRRAHEVWETGERHEQASGGEDH